jgi:hypothetical protein
MEQQMSMIYQDENVAVAARNQSRVAESTTRLAKLIEELGDRKPTCH